MTFWLGVLRTVLKLILYLSYKKGLRIITFSDYREYTSPLFANLKILKFCDLVYFYNGYWQCNLHAGLSFWKSAKFFLFVFSPKLTKDIVTTQDFPQKWLFLYHKLGLNMENLILDSPV